MTAPALQQSLLAALSAVPDPRSRHGRRYPLASVLALAVCAMACGARALYAIAQWGKQHKRIVCQAVGIARPTTPSHPQLHRIFAALDAAAFERVLTKWFTPQGLKPGEGIALDGKTLRGIHGEELPGVHLIAAFAHQRGLVLDQEPAPGKGQELEAVKTLLDRLDLHGPVVTGDALLAQRATSTKVVEKGGITSGG